MLSPELQVLTPNEPRPLKECREQQQIRGAVGWSQTGIDRVIDAYAHFDYRGPLLVMTTRKGHVLRCTPDHPCFCRLDTGNTLFYLYLMERSSLGFRLGLTQNLMQEVLAQQKIEGDLFQAPEVQDRIWIIEATENVQQAVFLHRLACFKYGLPDLPFQSRGGNGDLSDQLLRDLYERIDTRSRARQLLADSMMYEHHPHVTVRFAADAKGRSNAIQFILFGGEQRPSGGCYEHLIRIDGSVALSQQTSVHFQRRQTRQGTWHLEVTRADLDEAQLFVKTLAALDNLQVIRKIQLTRGSPFYILPASHLKLGMMVPVVGSKSIEEDRVVKIAVEDYQGPVYDLKVASLYNYLVDGWVVMANAGSLMALPVTEPPP